MGIKLIWLALAVLFSNFIWAAQLPPGFTETLFTDGVSNPTMLNFAPDGRLFVAQQSGTLLLIKDGVLNPNPVLKLDVASEGEHGLLGVTFDPDFAHHPYIYVYYSAKQPVNHNRVSRFLMNGDSLGPENVVFDFDNQGASIYHCGGTVKFGPDGKLYVGHGDNGGWPLVANAQQLDSLFGKMVRLNSDGSIPTDNPFYQTNQGNNRAIYAYGLRNPFTFDFLPSSNLLFVGDVGQDTWEEIDQISPGKNYGWPNEEGMGSDPKFVNPIYTYHHGPNPDQGCAITGGAFYLPKKVTASNFPANYNNQYFFTDYCGNSIRTLDPITHKVSPFALGIASNPVDLRVGPDGALYYVSKWFEGVYRVGYQDPAKGQ